jgi:hypothetical protein
MVRKISKEENRIQESLEKLPFANEDKKAWLEIIQDSGVNEEMIKDILAKSSHLTPAEGEDPLELARNTAELTRNIQSWRLSQNLRGFGNRGRQRRR